MRTYDTLSRNGLAAAATAGWRGTMSSQSMLHTAVSISQMPRTRPYLASVRRFVVIAAVAFWLGGFTFYSGVAIPMGVEVLGGHRTVGFITERVTNWLNVAGVITLAVLLWNMVAVRPSTGKPVRILLIVTWLVMAGIEIELICLHPVLDHLLVPHAREILNEDRFDLLHHVYLISSSVQWFAGVIHVAAISIAWQPRGVAPSESF
jgi:hypothetical protein